MRNWILGVIVIAALGVLGGCTSSKNVAYMQGVENITEEEYQTQSVPLYDARIMPKDLLTVTVTTTDPEASRPFNLTTPTISTGISTSGGYGQLQTYLVDNNGDIEFPVVGAGRSHGVNQAGSGSEG